MIAVMAARKKRRVNHVEKHRGKQVTFYCDPDLVQIFTDHVERQHKDRSEMLRHFMVEYLRNAGVAYERKPSGET